jgi:hypothetical protein
LPGIVLEKPIRLYRLYFGGFPAALEAGPIIEAGWINGRGNEQKVRFENRADGYSRSLLSQIP